ncbi:MAG TPA: type 2 isopentenyl-diphosphate Delta-isomerase [Candidatus Bathyarchaeia archaeon]|nr:type 2 isopentenyl-diphosphate Delta-isomerase [Candidatus Bathyarchaeia archaeon]
MARLANRGRRPDVRPPAGPSAGDAIAARKQSHLDLCLREDVEAAVKTNLFEEVELVHDALPDLAYEDLDLRSRWLGKELRLPFVITSMTGGTSEAFAINRDLAIVAEEAGIAFGVGSQRAMQRRPDSEWTFRVREFAPTTVLLGNIGLAQARTMSPAEFAPLRDALGADGLCVHLNVAQELIQPEGDRDFRGGAALFRRLVRELDIPVIAKETGCGISRGVALRLADAGVRNVDVSGAGGTSWVRIEALREGSSAALGEVYRDWGIPTAASLLQLRGLGLTTVASGGIRSGLDAAKAIALGAALAGVALPVYQAYRRGGLDGAREFIDLLAVGLRAAMLLTGSRRLADLKRAEMVVGPSLERWRPSGGRRRAGKKGRKGSR